MNGLALRRTRLRTQRARAHMRRMRTQRASVRLRRLTEDRADAAAAREAEAERERHGAIRWADLDEPEAP